MCNTEYGWQCTAASPSVCTEECGKGTNLGTYACDDGNTIDGDGCSATCTVEAPDFQCFGGTFDRPDDCHEVCGDGNDHHWFPCDDGNNVDDDGCSHDCFVEENYYCRYGMPGRADVCWTACGDGRTVPNGIETCDDGVGSINVCLGTTGCASCAVVTGWTCWNSTPYTTSECVEVCGSGCNFQTWKQCDDGNLVNGDGCN